MQTNGSHGFYPGRYVPWPPSLDSVKIMRLLNLIAFYTRSALEQVLSIDLLDKNHRYSTWIVQANSGAETNVSFTGWPSPINIKVVNSCIAQMPVSDYNSIQIARLVWDNSFSETQAGFPVIAELESHNRNRNHLRFLNFEWCVEHWLDLSSLQINPSDKKIIAVWLHHRKGKQRIIRLLHLDPQDGLNSGKLSCWADLKSNVAIISALNQVGITSQPHAEIVARLLTTNAPQEPVIY